MPRSFNTAGPCVQGDYCMLDPLARLDVDEVLRLIDDKRYFVLHAPRQTGKTTSLIALMKRLNDRAARDRSVPITLERYKAARERLIQSRATHLDQLTDKLRGPRVHRLITAFLVSATARLGRSC